MRYTECRLTTLTKNALLADLELDTVDMVENFDASQMEPLVLPASVPMLLLNGASGIAVGMATNIPPHNIGEILNACIALIRDPGLSNDNLMQIVPGPDFPTGGSIMGKTGVRNMYTTGRGGIQVRATTHIEQIPQKRGASRDAIIVTELPYQTQKAGLVVKIAELVNSKKLDGIADLRDESDRDGMRLVIELKREENVDVVLNNLLKKTGLQSSFSANMLALDSRRNPTRFTLRSFLKEFLAFRLQVVRRRAVFQKSKAADKLHVTKGFLVAQRSIDEVVKVIRGSDDSSSARESLMSDFGLSAIQADAVLGMPLRRLTTLEADRVQLEAEELSALVQDLEDLLQSPQKLDELMVKEFEEISRLCASPRRTRFSLDDGDIDEISLVQNNESVLLVSKQGYVKRLPVEEFNMQGRNSRGKAGTQLKEDDVVEHFAYCRDRDSVLVFSNKGFAYVVPAYKIPAGSRVSRGRPLSQLIPRVEPGESIASVLPVAKFEDEDTIILLTKQGFVKRTAISKFSGCQTRGLRAIGLAEDDQLGWVRRCRGQDSVVLGSRHGMALRFVGDLVPPSGRGSRGCMTMTLRSGDEIVDMDIISDRAPAHGASSSTAGRGKREKQLILITENGRGKRLRASDFRILKSRRALGVRTIQVLDEDKVAKPGEDSIRQASSCVLALRQCYPGDEIMMITSAGTINRQSVDSIPVQSRSSKGVLVQKLDANDSVIGVTVVRTQDVNV